MPTFKDKPLIDTGHSKGNQSLKIKYSDIAMLDGPRPSDLHEDSETKEDFFEWPPESFVDVGHDTRKLLWLGM